MAALNVEKLSLKELIALEAKLAAAIATARQKERAEIKSKVAELAERHGFSVSELFGGLGAATAGRSPSALRNTPTPMTRPIPGLGAGESQIGFLLD